jgi:DNA-binding winged helix-turn-helix (wHTH) protein/tetratricopeptide (TPR) repeat protein
MYRFGDFRLDPATRELLRDTNRIVLPPKAFECLLWLIEHRDRAVGRDELIAAVWGKTDAADNLLAQVILRLRRMLDDDRGESAIRTIPRFGYRWVATTERVEATASAQPVEAAPDEPARTARGPARVWWASLLLLALLGGGLAWLLATQRATPEGNIDTETGRALVLPVEIEAPPGNEWMRLGLMALMSDRLHRAGQPVVPGENVVALVGAHAQEPVQQIGAAARATWPAAVVIAAHARATEGRWTVSLSALRGSEPPLRSVADAVDALDAARLVADRMARQLGFAPVAFSAADYAPSLAQLLARVEAATLAGQVDDARALLDAAPAERQDLPELRYQRAWLDFHSGQMVEAQQQFESLLRDLSPTDAPLMRARCLNGLANVQYARADYEGLARSAGAAIALLRDLDAPGEFGRALISRAVANAEAGDTGAAQRDFAQARVALESAGDRLGVARAELAAGTLAKRVGRLSEALSALQGAATQLAAFDDVHDELLARVHLAGVHLLLLDPAAALAIEPQLRALAARERTPRVRALANLARIETLFANGRLQAATALLREACGGTDARMDCGGSPWPLQFATIQLVLNPASGSDALRTALAALPADERGRDPGRAWLALLRSELARGRSDEDGTLLASIDAWARRDDTPEGPFYAALARAELRSAQGDDAAAREGFETARALAETGQVPGDMLLVAQAYTDWLIQHDDLATASIVAGRLAGWAARDYDAAIVQLRLQHALGHPASWRSALEHAQALAGERALPAALLRAPSPRQSAAGAAQWDAADGRISPAQP